MLQLWELKEQLIKDLNEANLPIDAVYYVLKDIVEEVSSVYNQQIQQLQMEKNAAASAKEDESRDDSQDEPATAALEIEEKEEK